MCNFLQRQFSKAIFKVNSGILLLQAQQYLIDREILVQGKETWTTESQERRQEAW